MNKMKWKAHKYCQRSAFTRHMSQTNHFSLINVKPHDSTIFSGVKPFFSRYEINFFRRKSSQSAYFICKAQLRAS